jgi:hypothetical protein
MDDICCFSKGKLNYLSSIPYHLQRSWRGWSIASGTMQHCTTPMIARSLDNRSNQLLSKGGLNLKLVPKLKRWWRLINTHFQLTQLKCLARTRHELSCRHLIRLKIKESLILKIK